MLLLTDVTEVVRLFYFTPSRFLKTNHLYVCIY